MKLKMGDCVQIEAYGPLCVIDRFRDSSGTVYVGINGKDGIYYNFNACEVSHELTRGEFDRATASV